MKLEGFGWIQPRRVVSFPVFCSAFAILTTQANMLARLARVLVDCGSEQLRVRAALLQALGSGFEIIAVGSRRLIRSVPTELNRDHNEILEMAQVSPAVQPPRSH